MMRTFLKGLYHFLVSKLFGGWDPPTEPSNVLEGLSEMARHLEDHTYLGWLQGET